MRRPKVQAINPGYSIALWVRSNGAPAEIGLHVNLWRLDVKRNGLTVDALDLGIVVNNDVTLETISLFLPFKIEVSDVVDLGSFLHDPDVAIAIFNEAVTVARGSSKEPDFLIEMKAGPLRCRKLDVAADLRIVPIQDAKFPAGAGSTMVFSERAFGAPKPGERRYVRFRVNLSKAGQAAFFTKYDPTDRRLLSGYDETEVVDFRFNERRNLPGAVVQELASGTDFHLREINYFVIRHITDDLTLSHGELKKCRTLESGVWTSYLAPNAPAGTTLRNALIFYWRKKAEGDTIDDWNALARFKRRRTDWKTVAVSLAIVVAVSAFASYLAGLAPSPNWFVAPRACTLPAKEPANPPGISAPRSPPSPSQPPPAR